MKISILMLLTLIIAVAGLAQSNQTSRDTANKSASNSIQKSTSFVTGYYYYGHSAGEIGIATVITSTRAIDANWGSFYASSEFFYNEKFFIGPKVGASSSGGLSMAVNFIYYTNFNQSSLQFRPEFGMGMDKFRFYYGRNMRITNTGFNFVSKNLVGFNLYFQVKNIKANQKKQHRLQR